VGARGSTIVCLAITAVIIAVLLQDCDSGGSAAQRGKQIFDQKAMCLSCHWLGEHGGQNAPVLDHVATKFIALKGGREQARAWFHAHLVDPKNNPGTEKAKFPFTEMPPFEHALDPDELEDLIEYVLSLE